MKNAFNAVDSETSKKLIELKNNSYSKLGVFVFEKDEKLAIAPLNELQTGLLVFDCGGVTLFISEKIIKKTGGLDLKYQVKEDLWEFTKNDYKQYTKEPAVNTKSVKKVATTSNKSKKKSSNSTSGLKGDKND